MSQSVSNRSLFIEDQWHRNPSYAANCASHRVLDAASSSTSVTVEEAKEVMATLMNCALQRPDRYVQDNAMLQMVIPTIRSNQALLGLGSDVQTAYREYTDIRNFVMNPTALAASGIPSATASAMLAGARQAFDARVETLVGETVAHLAALPPPPPGFRKHMAALGEAAERSVREWRAAGNHF